jgi:hypothetical protein
MSGFVRRSQKALGKAKRSFRNSPPKKEMPPEGKEPVRQRYKMAGGS